MPMGRVPLDIHCSRTAKVLASNSQSTFQEYSLTDAWNYLPLPVFLPANAFTSVITESKREGYEPRQNQIGIKVKQVVQILFVMFAQLLDQKQKSLGNRRVAYGLTYLSSSQLNCQLVGQQKASFPAMYILALQNPFLLQYGIAQISVHLHLNVNCISVLCFRCLTILTVWTWKEEMTPVLRPRCFLPDWRMMISLEDSQPFS